MHSCGGGWQVLCALVDLLCAIARNLSKDGIVISGDLPSYIFRGNR